jgi:hypothetical protein
MTELLTIHWKAGVLPPLTGIAVKVTAVPLHTGFEVAKMVTPTCCAVPTLMTTVLDVAGFPPAQTSEEVMTQVTASLLIGMKL